MPATLARLADFIGPKIVHLRIQTLYSRAPDQIETTQMTLGLANEIAGANFLAVRGRGRGWVACDRGVHDHRHKQRRAATMSGCRAIKFWEAAVPKDPN